MTCHICKHGETQSGTVTVTLERQHTTLVFKGVTAQVCENCGEAYVSEQTTRKLLELAEQAHQAGVEVEIRTFVA
jgi:YgiT-type zinc finger domain-containing protein